MNKLTNTKPSMAQDLENRANTILEVCRNFLIADDASYQLADKRVSETASLEKGIIDYWKPMKKASYDAWKLQCAREAEMLAPIKEGGELLTGKMKTYRYEREEIERKKQEEEQKKREEQARLEAFKLAEEGAPQEVVEAVEQLASEPIEVAPTQELRSKTSFVLDYTVEVIKGKEHLIPAEILKPTTPQMVKALEAKVKKLAKVTGGEQIPGLKIIQTETARRRQV